MLKLTRDNAVLIVLMEIASVAPVLILLGNLLDLGPFKVHYIGLGLLFLAAGAVAISSKGSEWLVYIPVVFLIAQPIFTLFSLKGFVDFFFGPMLLFAMLYVQRKRLLPMPLLQLYARRFYMLLLIPMAIAVLQYLHILPITFLNATYENYTDIGGEWLPRPNGWLYHGSELSILIFFAMVRLYLRPPHRTFVWMLAVVACAFVTYFKTITATTVVMLLAFYVYLDKRWPWYRIDHSKWLPRLVYASAAAGILWVVGFHIYGSMKHTGYPFHPPLLTGRGSIWNIYIDGIKDFSPIQWLLGYGMGMEAELFAATATPKNFYPLTIDPVLHVTHGTHNTLLGVFVNGGLLGLAYIFSILVTAYRYVMQFQDKRWMRRFFLLVTVVPVMMIGVTIPLYEMAIYWPCFGFLLIALEGAKNHGIAQRA